MHGQLVRIFSNWNHGLEVRGTGFFNRLLTFVQNDDRGIGLADRVANETVAQREKFLPFTRVGKIMLPSRQHPWRVALSLTIAVLFSARSASNLAAEERPGAQQMAEQAVSQSFASADRNRDQRLSLDEFLLKRGEANAARRDFLLFDQDADAALNLAEFSAVPTVVAAEHRGPLPDPMQAVVDQVMTALDKSLDDWHKTPKVEVDARGFLTAFSLRFQKFGMQPAEKEADPDNNQKVTREEARRFIEIQFGVRRADGKLLREPGGRVVNYMLYLHVDQNKNDKLERAEFIERSYGDASVAKEFDAADINHDDSLSFDEWCRVPGRSYVDPVTEFRQMDTNFDAYVDPHELLAGTPDWKKPLVIGVLPGCDLDRDGRLSLAEYRLTMSANMVLPWHTKLTDSDGDGTLSFAEFRFEPMLFPLLRVLYFNRLDADSNGSLDPKEFSFTLKVPDEFFVMNADGTGWKSLFLFEGHPACGSPAVSPDGKQIAFDAWPLKQQGGSAVFVMSIDGGDPRQIDTGMMPTWSKDGSQLACSRNSPKYGVWLMGLEGADHQFLAQGWGAQFSPDGSQIAFAEGTALKVYDLNTRETHTVLDGEDNPYQQIYWNSTWSPDSKRLCFKGIKADGTQEVATVQMTGDKPELKVHHSGKLFVNGDFAWHPTEDRIVFSMTCPERSKTQLYEFNPNKADPPTLVKGQDETRNNTDISWTPDGKRLIIVSGDY